MLQWCLTLRLCFLECLCRVCSICSIHISLAQPGLARGALVCFWFKSPNLQPPHLFILSCSDALCQRLGDYLLRYVFFYLSCVVRRGVLAGATNLSSIIAQPLHAGREGEGVVLPLVQRLSLSFPWSFWRRRLLSRGSVLSESWLGRQAVGFTGSRR